MTDTTTVIQYGIAHCTASVEDRKKSETYIKFDTYAEAAEATIDSRWIGPVIELVTTIKPAAVPLPTTVGSVVEFDFNVVRARAVLDDDGDWVGISSYNVGLMHRESELTNVKVLFVAPDED